MRNVEKQQPGVMARMALGAALVLLVAPAVAACSSDDKPANSAATPANSASASAAAASGGADATGKGAATGGPAAGGAGKGAANGGNNGAVAPPRQVKEASFLMPSRNIACTMYETVRCDVVGNTWTVPARPAQCEGDFGKAVRLNATDPAALVCASDTVMGEYEVLQYGQALAMRDFVCTSRQEGVDCVNSSSGHGFLLSREAYKLY